MACLAIAGGVGGARMAHGLSMVLPPDELIIAVNIGDDFTHLGLRICPDLDTVMYTLSGQANPKTGWGIQDETWSAMDALEKLGGPAWFLLGDRDLATHLERTNRLKKGHSLSRVTEHLCDALGIQYHVLPVSDSAVPTIVETTDGDLSFQDYFVRQQCAPSVTGFRFEGAEDAPLSPVLRRAVDAGRIDCIIICPSNPFVSIGPICAIPGIQALLTSGCPVVAVSPIVGGTAIKGPAAKMMSELGLTPSVIGIGDHYRDIADGIVIDTIDESDAAALHQMGFKVLVTNTVMVSEAVRNSLAAETIDFARALRD